MPAKFKKNATFMTVIFDTLPIPYKTLSRLKINLRHQELERCNIIETYVLSIVLHQNTINNLVLFRQQYRGFCFIYSLDLIKCNKNFLQLTFTWLQWCTYLYSKRPGSFSFIFTLFRAVL